MDNTFTELEFNELLEYDGGSVWSYALKLIEAAGIVDAIADAGRGFIDGFRYEWNK
jgi:hypothetical protein